MVLAVRCVFLFESSLRLHDLDWAYLKTFGISVVSLILSTQQKVGAIILSRGIPDGLTHKLLLVNKGVSKYGRVPHE